MSEIDKHWISAGKLRNYALNDPIIDWLNMYRGKHDFVPTKSPDAEQSMNCGVEFEDDTMNKLTSRCKQLNLTITSLPETFNYKQLVKQTLDLLSSGTHVISQALVYNSLNKTFGFPDLLVRSDIAAKLFPDMEDPKQTGCKWSTDWHYIVIDIKSSELHLTNGFLSNKASQKAYKCQVYIYNEAIGLMQSYTPQVGYIFNNVIAPIDYSTKDKFIKRLVPMGLDWLKRLRKDGASWKVFPRPSVSELYPNMNTHTITEWDTVKLQIAYTIHELTLVWNCTFSNRLAAHEAGIFEYTDPKLTSSVLNIKDKQVASVIDTILETNRGTKQVIVTTTLPTHSLEYYCIDDEIVNQQLEPITDIDDSAIVWYYNQHTLIDAKSYINLYSYFVNGTIRVRGTVNFDFESIIVALQLQSSSPAVSLCKLIQLLRENTI